MKRTNKKFSAPTAWGQCGASVRQAAMTLLTIVMAFTAQTAWAGYGWYDASMSIGGITTNPSTWSTSGDTPTDLGTVTDMTITSIAFNVWSDANDRGGANMYFRIYDDNGQVGTDQDIHLGTATRIAGNHDFSISYTTPYDLASAVELTLELGKTYYIDMWAKTYGSSGDEWYSNGGANYHAKLTYVPNGNCGTTDHESDVTWSLNSGGVLTISGSGAMADYTDTGSNWAPWLSYKDNITSVVIGEGVTSIGDFAFYECVNLASVSIPASVTSIGQGAFNHCGRSATALTVTFATGSSLTTIGNGAFNGAKLSSISIPASVTSISQGAFDGCEYLTTIDIPASVTSIGAGAFYGCGKQVDTALTVTFATGSSLTTIGILAFAYANLNSITIPASVISIGESAFSYCENLTTIDIPASVTSIGLGAFIDCTNLTTVTLHSNPFIGDYASFPASATVTMNLTANSAGNAKWMTFYNQNYSFEADANTQVFKVALSGKGDLTMNKVDNRIVDAGTAVVLKTTGGGNPVMTLTTTASGDEQANSLRGVAGPGVETSDGTMFVLNNGSQGVGFYKLTSGKTLGVGKAYLSYPDPQPGSQEAREFLGFGDTTGINDVRCQKEDVRGEYYDLQGRRVSQPTKGLYIVNGKKVVIK